MLALILLSMLKILPDSFGYPIATLLVNLYFSLYSHTSKEIEKKVKELGIKNFRLHKYAQELAKILLIMLNPQKWVNKVSIKGIKNLKTPSLVVTFHFGPWEILPLIFVNMGYKVAVVSESQKNKPLNYFLKKLRKQTGAIYCNSIADITPLLKKDYLVGFLLDKTSRVPKIKVNPFDCKVNKLPFILARRYKVPIIPMAVFLQKSEIKVEIPKELSVLNKILKERYYQWILWGN